MKNLCVILAALVGSVLLCDPARGDVTFSYYVSQPNYDVLPGNSIGVPVYLQEAVTDPDVSLLVAEDGLFSAGVLVQRTASSLGQPVVITLTGTSANEADFDDLFGPTITVVDDHASIFEMRDLGNDSGVLGDETFTGSGVRRILLGTFTFMAGATAGEVTTFQVADNTTDDTRTWTSFTLLDPIYSTSFTVTVVPVPSSILLCITGLFTIVLRRRGL